ncbi:hypothetical protein [Anaeromyxobacter paludicola]|uniref:Uncharacterized protein n=1 Tax=Anaeromyxobacter paludicola TaxID=2918171 RepID=A0ABM7X843_9BACT|nr:hypothetical protein [Anaeromyxobacter paludicola]BDG08018.1 hypothetical protein AMPC_11310 [Anaeromyxobacter paludicola]
MSATRQLLEALAEGARRLEAGDAPGASAALGRAAESCRALQAAGTLLDAQSLDTFRLLQGRCEGLARAAQAKLQAALDGAAAGRLAQAAYRRR